MPKNGHKTASTARLLRKTLSFISELLPKYRTIASTKHKPWFNLSELSQIRLFFLCSFYEYIAYEPLRFDMRFDLWK